MDIGQEKNKNENNDTFPAHLSDQVEAHEYKSIDGDSGHIYDMITMSYSHWLNEDFPDLPDLKPFDLFSLCFIRDMISNITAETMRYAHHVSQNNIHQFLGLILIIGYHTLPAEID